MNTIDFNKQNINEEYFRKLFASSADIKIQNMSFPQEKNSPFTILLVYCEGMCNSDKLNEYIVPNLKIMAENHPISTDSELQQHMPFHIIPLESDHIEKTISDTVLQGDLLLYFEHTNKIFSVNLAHPPQRRPEEPNTEMSVRGPKDGFTEEALVNVALIRKRLKTNILAVEEYKIGTQTETKINLLFLSDVIEESTLKEIQKRMGDIQIKALISTNQLEEILVGFSLFPLFAYTGRPDFAVNALLHGRFVLIVDGSPTAIIAPVNLIYLFSSSEDAHASNLFVMFTRFLRICGFTLSLFLPGFWIAIATFHLDQLPFTLLATLVNSRQGVPLPVPLEGLVMLILFELFREAGMRLPSSFGQTLSVVGGLIIGQAAISAGISSPGSIVVIAISVLATFTLVNQNLVGIISLIRIFILIISGIFGLFGLLICLLAVTLYLVNLRSFGTFYLTPLSPPKFGSIFKVFFRTPWGKKE